MAKAKPQSEPKVENAQQKIEGKENEKDKATELPKIEFQEVIKTMFESYGKSGTDDLQISANSLLAKYIEQEICDNKIIDDYNIAIIFDSTVMVKSDADSVYNSIKKFDIEKPVLLVLYSYGGDGGSAYLISQLYREYCNGTFIVTVPRAAKSAATLLCCAADEIHMGSLSELGPIDPQLNGNPALGLKNAIEHIAQLAAKNPGSSEMFAKYLSLSLKPIEIGYYERVAESSLQYAERLLQIHGKNLVRDAKQIAYDLVYTYKDHGFVIDKNEAKSIFGEKVIKINSPEYDLGNKVYNLLKMIEGVATFLGYDFYFNGILGSEPTFRKRKHS